MVIGDSGSAADWGALQRFIDEKTAFEKTYGRPASLTQQQRQAIAALTSQHNNTAQRSQTQENGLPVSNEADWISLLNAYLQQKYLNNDILEFQDAPPRNVHNRNGKGYTPKFHSICIIHVPEEDPKVFPREGQAIGEFSTKKMARKYAARLACAHLKLGPAPDADVPVRPTPPSQPMSATQSDTAVHRGDKAASLERIGTPEVQTIPSKRSFTDDAKDNVCDGADGGVSIATAASEDPEEMLTAPLFRSLTRSPEFDVSSAMKTINNLCNELKLKPPRFEPEQERDGDGTWSCTPDFDGDPQVLEGVGEVKGKQTLETAKVEATQDVLKWLTALKAAREERLGRLLAKSTKSQTTEKVGADEL